MSKIQILGARQSPISETSSRDIKAEFERDQEDETNE
jgi:hypothetical protein